MYSISAYAEKRDNMDLKLGDVEQEPNLPRVDSALCIEYLSEY